MNDDAPRVLTQACLRALHDWQLSALQSAAALGLAPSEFAALESGVAMLVEGSLAWQRGLAVARLYVQLTSVVGSTASMAVWMHSPNRALDGCPADLLKDMNGIERVVAYITPA